MNAVDYLLTENFNNCLFCKDLMPEDRPRLANDVKVDNLSNLWVIIWKMLNRFYNFFNLPFYYIVYFVYSLQKYISAHN